LPSCGPQPNRLAHCSLFAYKVKLAGAFWKRRACPGEIVVTPLTSSAGRGLIWVAGKANAAHAILLARAR
jgi:hypothetical protein